MFHIIYESGAIVSHYTKLVSQVSRKAEKWRIS